ncbi:MAG TPA: CHAT domain-containing tetratricopeptide repeat protein [Bacteroidales bacterium]|nr:CHAT domain-containing tetratricopeptide repeat protein [Bacteroidales bacterium]
MKTLKTLLVFLLTILCFHFSFGQDNAEDSVLAKKYFDKAIIYMNRTECDSAIQYFKKASFIYQESEMWQHYLYNEIFIAECFNMKNNFGEAYSVLIKAIGRSKNNLNQIDTTIARAYSSLALTYYRLGEKDSTFFYIEKSLEIKKKALKKDDLDVAELYRILGVLYDENGEYDLALKYYMSSLKIKKEVFTEMHEEVAAIYNNLGNTYDNKGEYDIALDFHKKSLNIKQNIIGDLNIATADSYNNIGVVYKNKGKYELALEYYMKSLDIKKQLLGDKSPEIAIAYNNIGNVFDKKQNFIQSIKYHKLALDLRLEVLGDKHPYTGISYLNLGTTYANDENYKLALFYFQKAHTIFNSILGEIHPIIAMTFDNIGSSYFYLDSIQTAYNYYLKALEIKKSIYGLKHPSIAFSYNFIGKIFFELNNYHSALEYFQKALIANSKEFVDETNIYSNPKLDNYFSSTYFIESLCEKARTFIKIANQTEKDRGENLRFAFQTYQLCDTLLNNLRYSSLRKSDKIELGRIANDIYDYAMDVCIQLSEIQDEKYDYFINNAFYFSERNKSSVLLEALAGAEAQKFSGIPDSLLQTEHNLSNEIALYKKLLAEQPDSAKEIKFRDKLFTANRQYDALIKTFENNYPKYFELKYNQEPASVKNIQGILDKKTAMICYFAGESATTIFTITENNMDITTVPTIKNLDDTIKNYRSGLIYTASSRFAAIYKRQAYEFYQKLIPQNIDPQIENLIIIPDAELSMIPFETFITEEAGSKDWNELSYLIKKYNVSYSYSANLFYKTFPKERFKEIETTELNDWLAFAPVFDDSNTAGLTLRTRELLQAFDSEMDDTLGARGRLLDGDYISPLPGTESEVEAIFREFDEKGKKALVQIKKKANEDFVKSGKLADYKYLHFATHGFVNTKKPELSGMFLAQDSTLNEDGILYQDEIYNLDLNADLTVLSACETGLGQIKKGEGLIGLTRALLYAGSKNIIVSLWKVADESTSDLMIDFYKHLLEEDQKTPEFSKALQQAKLEMINQGKYAHPFYWSPFILIGK